jgi:hypothetical protein
MSYYLNHQDDSYLSCEQCDVNNQDKAETFNLYLKPLLDMMYGKTEWNEWRFQNTLEDLLYYFGKSLPEGDLKIKEKIDNADLIKYFVSLRPAINQIGV